MSCSASLPHWLAMRHRTLRHARGCYCCCSWCHESNHCFNTTIGRTAGRNDETGIVVEGKRWGGLEVQGWGNDGGGGGIKPSTNLHGGAIWNKVLWTVKGPVTEHSVCCSTAVAASPMRAFCLLPATAFSQSDQKLFVPLLLCATGHSSVH